MDNFGVIDQATDSRNRSRIEIKEQRRESRSSLLQVKRADLKSTEVSIQSKLNEKDVLQIARNLRTVDSDQFAKLSQAFGSYPELSSAFIRVDGAVSELVTLLTDLKSSLCQSAADLLINLSLGPHATTKTLVKLTGPYLITYLETPSISLKTSCAWALGNMAADCRSCNDLLARQGCLGPLIDLLAVGDSVEVLSLALFAILCFLSTNSGILLNYKGVLTKLNNLMAAIDRNTFEYQSLLPDIIHIIFYYSSSDGCAHQLCENELLLSRLWTMLYNESKDLTPPTTQRIRTETYLVRTLSNILTSGERSGNPGPHINVLTISLSLLTSQYRFLQKEGLWFVSNIVFNFERELDVAEVFRTVLHLLHNTDGAISYEAIVCLHNIVVRMPALFDAELISTIQTRMEFLSEDARIIAHMIGK